MIRTTIRIGDANTSNAIRPTSTEKSIMLSVFNAFFQRAFISANFLNTFLSSRIFLMVVIAFIV